MSMATPVNVNLWLFRAIDHALPHLRDESDLLGALEKRISPLFHEKFPDEDIKDRLSRCWDDRNRSIAFLKVAPHAITPSGDIDFHEYIKYQIGINPRLTRGQMTESQAIFESNRERFCQELCHAITAIKGVDLDPSEIKTEIKVIQRHVLEYCDPPLMHSPPIFLGDLLPFVRLNFIDPDNKQSETEILLYDHATQLIKEITSISADNFFLNIYSSASNILRFSREELCPDLIEHEALFDDLLMVFAEHSTTASSAVERLYNCIDLSQALPEGYCSNFYRVCEAKDVSAQYALVKRFFKDEKTMLHFLKKAKIIPFTKTLKSKLFFLAASNSKFVKKFSETAPLTNQFIQAYLEKTIIESPNQTLIELIELAKNTLEDTKNSLEGLDLSSSVFIHSLKHACKLIVRQNDMLWRSIASLDQSKQRVIDLSCPLFRALQPIFEKFELPHPILNRDRILAEWESSYLKSFPILERRIDLVRQWANHYFKFLWYAQPDISTRSTRSGMSTIRLFIGYHAAMILKEFPGYPPDELVNLIQKTAQKHLPHYPIDEYDIRHIIEQILLRLRKTSEDTKDPG